MGRITEDVRLIDFKDMKDRYCKEPQFIRGLLDFSSFSDILKRELETDPEFKAEYEALEAEIDLFGSIIQMRLKAGLSQAEVARRMGRRPTSIWRLEQGKSSPTFNTVQKYAAACGYDAHITFSKSTD